MSRSKSAKIPVTVENKMKAGIQDCIGELGKFGKTVEGLKKLTIGAGIGTAIFKVGEAAKGCIEQFTAVEDSYLRMAKALGKDNYKKVIDTIGVLSKQTKASREEIVKMMSTMASMGMATTEMNKVAQAAIALSNVTGKDLGSSFEIMLDSLNGSTGEIEKFIPEVKTLTEEEKKLGGAIDIVTEKFGGLATSIATDSFSQSVSNIRNIIGDIGESIGGILTLSLSPAFTWAEEMLQSVSDKLKEIKETTQTRKTIDEIFGEVNLNATTLANKDEADKLTKALIENGISLEEFTTYMESKFPKDAAESITVGVDAAVVSGQRTSSAYTSGAGGSAYGANRGDINQNNYVEDTPSTSEQMMGLIADGLREDAEAKKANAAAIAKIEAENSNLSTDIKDVVAKFAGVTDLNAFDTPEFKNIIALGDSVMESLAAIPGGKDSDLYKILDDYLPVLKDQEETANKDFKKKLDAFINGSISVLGQTEVIQRKIDTAIELRDSPGVEKGSAEYELLNKIIEALKVEKAQAEGNTGKIRNEIKKSALKILDKYDTRGATIRGYDEELTSLSNEKEAIKNDIVSELLAGVENPDESAIDPAVLDDLLNKNKTYQEILKTEKSIEHKKDMAERSNTMEGKILNLFDKYDLSQPGNAEVAKQTGQTMILDGLAEAIGPLMEIFDQFFYLIESGCGWLMILIPIIEGFANTVLPMIESVLSPITDFLKLIGSTLGNFFGPIFESLRESVMQIISILADILLPILDMLAPVLDLVASILDILHPILQDVAYVFGLVMIPVNALATTLDYTMNAIVFAVDWAWAKLYNFFHPLHKQKVPDWDDRMGEKEKKLKEAWDFEKQEKELRDKLFGEKSRPSNSTETSIQSATYNGAMTVNIYPTVYGPVVGDGGMEQFANMIKEKFEEMEYYGA